MAQAIRHRGPDDGGVYADGPVGHAFRTHTDTETVVQA
jgi:asparagine synthetase B (glutamine-hydrolysing)